MNLNEKQIAFFEAEKEWHKKKLADIDDRINAAIQQFENERNAEVEAIDAIQQVIDASRVSVDRKLIDDDTANDFNQIGEAVETDIAEIVEV